RTLGLELHVLHASTEGEFEPAFARLMQLRAGGLVIGTDGFLVSRSERLAALTLRHALPAIFQYRAFAEAGGLMSFRGHLAGFIPPFRRVYGPHPQGRKTSRSSCAASHQSRADNQSQDRQGARPHDSTAAYRPR